MFSSHKAKGCGFVEEPVVLITAKENCCTFSADGGLLLQASGAVFV